MTRMVRVFAGCALTALFCLSAAAQDAPVMMRLGYAKVKPEMMADYVDLQKMVNEGIKKTDIPWRQVWRTDGLGEMGMFVSVMPLAKMARMDEPNMLAKAMGEAAYAQYMSRVRRCLDSMQYMAVMQRPDLSIQSERQTPVKMAVVATYHIAPGKLTAFENLVKSDVLPAMRKIGVKDYWVNKTMLGGDPNSYTSIYVVEDFATLDAGPPLIQALGQEGYARLSEKFAGIIVSMTNQVARRDADLSWAKQ